MVTEAVVAAEIIAAAGWRGPACLVRIRHLTDALHCNFHHHLQAEGLPAEDRLQSAACMNQLWSGVTGRRRRRKQPIAAIRIRMTLVSYKPPSARLSRRVQMGGT